MSLPDRAELAPVSGPAPAGRGPGRALGQQSQRPSNLAAVMGVIVEATEPPTRADISALTGLTRASVSALVDSLLASRLVEELAPVSGQRLGRPGVPLAPARGTVAGIGAEVNVDYLAVRVVDLAGHVLTETVVSGDFRASKPRHVLDRLRALMSTSLTAMEAKSVGITGVGIALPGLVDARGGPLRVAPNLGWHDIDVVGLSTLRTDAGAVVPIVGNEADLAARAEMTARRQEGPWSFIYVSGEVGVGAAIVIDGSLLTGRHGWSGEIGHSVVSVGDSGGTTTLEQLAGQDSILTLAGLPLSTSIEKVVSLAESADARVIDALSRAGDALGVALANVVNIIDIDHVVMGGIYATLIDFLREPIEARLRQHVVAAPWAPVHLHDAKAGPFPAVTGAALTALDVVVADPSSWIAAPRNARST